ncbi:hypothetical protein [Kitasatospora sp. Root107]|nr:hypothetical protein [Kitasatospora sp. Root107]
MIDATDHLHVIRTNATAQLFLDAAEFMPKQRKPTDHIRRDNGF